MRRTKAAGITYGNNQQKEHSALSKHVCILMATYNGAVHLRAQLDSIAAQTHRGWSLHVSDDNSTDGTSDIVMQFARDYPEHKITLATGPRGGSAANFMSLAAQGGWPAQSWLAFCDQDDVWMPDRLTRAQRTLTDVGTQQPGVYASRTILTDAGLKPRQVSRLHAHAPAFGNALVQNILAGNTLVLTPAAADILHRTAPLALKEQGVPHHDWWVYLLMSGVGAHIVNDAAPSLYYRQHEENHLGANRGLRKAMNRLATIWGGRYADWLDRNIAALERVAPLLTPENKTCLTDFTNWRLGQGRGLLGGGLHQIGVWRQSNFGNVMMRLCAVFNRL